MKKLPIRIMTRRFQLIDETKRYESLQITRSWHGIGVMEMRINRHIKKKNGKRVADEFIKDRIIFPHNQLNKAYIIKHREIELDENGKATENWIIRAPSLKSWVAQRFTYPPSHTAYDYKQANAETVMHHYVNNNLINPADPNRRMSDIVLAPNQKRGDTVIWQSRFKNLAEELKEISLVSGLGWNIEVDLELRKFVFKVLEGRNLSANQSVLPPAIFSPEFNTLGEMKFTESELNYKNFAVVGGQGEGVDRRIINIGDSSGFDRHELFVDARDVAEETDDEDPQPRPEQDIIADLTSRGHQRLKEHESQLHLEGQALTKSRLIYGINYDLGDIVTTQNRDWGVTMDPRITEVKEIYEANGKKIELTFGQSRPTLETKIKQELKNASVDVAGGSSTPSVVEWDQVQGKPTNLETTSGSQLKVNKLKDEALTVIGHNIVTDISSTALKAGTYRMDTAHTDRHPAIRAQLPASDNKTGLLLVFPSGHGWASTQIWVGTSRRMYYRVAINGTVFSEWLQIATR